MRVPKVSVIVPIYNAECYLEQCLDSIINQTLSDIEIILIDDCSVDSSFEICERYSDGDSRIKLIRQNKNCGAGGCRNAGIKYSTAEYLFFFDADDFMELDTLEKLYEKAKSSDSDILICNSREYIEEQQVFKDITNSLDLSLLGGRKIFNPIDVKEKLFQFCVGWAWDKLFKHDFIKKEELNYPCIKHSEDLSFVFSALACAKKITYIEDKCVFHRTHADSLSATRNIAPECFYYAQLKLKEILEQKGLYKIYEKSFVNFCLKFSKWHMVTVKDNKAMKKFFKQLLKEIDFNKFSDSDIYDYSLYLFAKSSYHPIIALLKRSILIIYINFS